MLQITEILNIFDAHLRFCQVSIFSYQWRKHVRSKEETAITGKIYRLEDLERYTFKALIVLPDAMASHSPVTVECPVFIVMPWIWGDQARLVMWLEAVYAMTGSVTIRFFASGRGELSREVALLGDAVPWV